jgi:hypothetical protein
MNIEYIHWSKTKLFIGTKKDLYVLNPTNFKLIGKIKVLNYGITAFISFK